MEEAWPVYRGDGEPHDGIANLPDPPPWRDFTGGPALTLEAGPDADLPRRLGERGTSYRPDDDVIDAVNAALYLRRPLLVTGRPGTGKSTLAYSVARELRLGPVLYWPISSRSTLAEGLYGYDAIGRLQEAGLRHALFAQGVNPLEPPPATPPAVTDSPGREAPSGPPQPGDAKRVPLAAEPPDVGRYVRLGALGTALLPWDRPRVLLIDELDKSDIDLPNDLLNVFEEGRYDIPELARLTDEQVVVEVETADGGARVPVARGLVACRAFPFVVITNNGERRFPTAFQRRCVRLDIKQPDRAGLVSIVTAQLGAEAARQSEPIIEAFLQRRGHGELATDQLLNAIYLAMSGSRPEGESRDRLIDRLLRTLDSVESA